MILWGIATVGMGLVNNFEGLVAMRVLLGFLKLASFRVSSKSKRSTLRPFY